MRDTKGYWPNFPQITWPGGARLAVSVVVHYEEGAERTILDGASCPEPESEGFHVTGNQRDVHGESIYEYGSRCGVWRLFRILEKHNLKCTFFCCGLALERNPQVGERISTGGHEASGHGYHWIPYHGISREEQRLDIRRAVRAIEHATGVRPIGWNSRAPNEDTRSLLIEEGGFLYDSDTYGDEVPYFVLTQGKNWLTVPYTLVASDQKFWAPESMPGFSNPDNFFRTLKWDFDRLYDESSKRPLMMSIGLRPRISGRPSRARQVDRFFKYAKEFPGVWFARRDEIARYWCDQVKTN